MPRPLLPLALGAVAVLVLLVLHLVVQRLLFSGSALRSDLAKGNAARAMLEIGHVVSVFLIAGSAVVNCGEGTDLARDAMWIAVFGGAAVGVSAVVARLGVRTLLESKLEAEIARGNVAAGIAAASHLVATGILVSRAIGGSDWASLGISLVFFVLGQITLHGFVILFRALTVYDDAEEILGENIAAALSYAGMTVGVSIVIGHAVEGQFMGWSTSLLLYGEALLLLLAFWPVRQLIVQGLLVGGGLHLRGGALDEGISRGRNVGLGALEAAAYIATAILVTRLG